MPLNKSGLGKLIPHAGRMSLLDTAQTWDDQHIVCSATSHRDADNPLRRHGKLHVLCGVEYAAQAMAVHGALSKGAMDATPGYLAAVRDLRWSVERLDDLNAPLNIEAERLIGDDRSVLYAFRVSTGERELLTGRASIFFSPHEDPLP